MIRDRTQGLWGWIRRGFRRWEWTAFCMREAQDRGGQEAGEFRQLAIQWEGVVHVCIHDLSDSKHSKSTRRRGDHRGEEVK